MLQQLPSSMVTLKLKKIIKHTPLVRKIYNKIDTETLIILGDKDIQVPLKMFDEYFITNLVVLKNQDHSITKMVSLKTLDLINKFIRNSVGFH